VGRKAKKDNGESTMGFGTNRRWKSTWDQPPLQKKKPKEPPGRVPQVQEAQGKPAKKRGSTGGKSARGESPKKKSTVERGGGEQSGKGATWA